MSKIDPVQLHAVAAAARARLVTSFAASDDDPGPRLTGQCVPASFYLRDALRAAGFTAAVVMAGYFDIADPDPEICACGSYRGVHDEACYFEPHSWVQVADWLVDASCAQFNAMNEEQFDELVVLPLADALQAGPWRSHLSWADQSWVPGETETFEGELPAGLGSLSQ